MTTWPNTLPSSPLLENFREVTPDTTVRTQMDQGPAKVRQRTTAAVRLLQVVYLLSRDQVETLDEFYLETLQGGTAPFEFIHPRTEASVSCRFVAPTEYAAANGNFFRAALILEVLP